MKNILFSFVLITFFNFNSSADNCDSVVATHYYSEYGNDYWDTKYFVVDSLHRIIRINNSEYFEFDSLGRTIKHGNGSTLDSTVFDDVQHTVSTYRINYSYPYPVFGLFEGIEGVNAKDSLINIYNSDSNGNLFLFLRQKYFYNQFDSLELALAERYDTITMIFTLSDSITYNWAADNLSYTSQVYMIDGSGVAQLDQDNSVTYDPDGNIIGMYNSGSYLYGWPGYSNSYDIQCGKRYIGHSASVGGSGQDFSTESYNYTYDSLCNPSHISGYHSDNNASYNFYVDYFYGDCNHITVVPQEFSICPGQTNLVHPQVLGGTGMQTYQWQPADSVSGPNDLYTVILCTTPQNLSLLVTDGAGHSYNYTLPVSINTFTYHVTDANCSTCSSGSIQLYGNGNNNTYTIVPGHSQPFPGVFTNLRPGVYYVCSHSANCTYCDSITVNDLSVSISELENDLLSVSPNPFSEKIILKQKNNSLQYSSKWKLFEANGRLLKEGFLDEKEISIEAEDLSSGIYFLQIVSDKENLLCKMIKN